MGFFFLSYIESHRSWNLTLVSSLPFPVRRRVLQTFLLVTVQESYPSTAIPLSCRDTPYVLYRNYNYNYNNNNTIHDLVSI